ncbi:MAG: hypothetical protein AB8B57_16360 [Congregibacter sp.]
MQGAALLSRFALAATALMLLAHLVGLFLSGADAASTPISQLSRGTAASLHTTGLSVLAMAQLALATALWRIGDTSHMWRIGCILLAVNAPLLTIIAIYFLRAPDAQLFGPDANDPLAILASNVGVIMALLQPGLKRLAPRAARINLIFFVLWLALIPVIPFIESDWLGAYERSVGATLLTWIASLAWTVSRVADKPQSRLL